jgi:hypothetical protein
MAVPPPADCIPSDDSDDSAPTVPRIVLTPRDVAILIDLARFGVLSASQLRSQLRRRHFPDGGSPGTAWNRLRNLRLAGLLERVLWAPGQEHAYLPTAKGCQAVGLDLLPPQRRGWLPVYLVHHLVVAEIADVLLERRYKDGMRPSWVTERELRLGVPWLGDEPVGPHERVPDGVLVLTPPPGAPGGLPTGAPEGGPGETVDWRTAVAVELHQKTARRLEAKLAWYTWWLNRGAFHEVVWYASEGAPLWAIQRAIATAGEQRQMRVLPLPPGVVVPGLG